MGNLLNVTLTSGVTSNSGVVSTLDNLIATITGYYVEVAASTSNAAIQESSGAIGDYVAGILVTPISTSPGAITLYDGSTSLPVFAGGASSLSNLVPFFIPIGALSRNAGWTLTTGGSLSALVTGRFS